MNLKQYDAFQLDVSLNLVPGRITGLIGKNGSGKTTIYKILMGLVKMKVKLYLWIKRDGSRME